MVAQPLVRAPRVIVLAEARYNVVEVLQQALPLASPENGESQGWLEIMSRPQGRWDWALLSVKKQERAALSSHGNVDPAIAIEVASSDL